MDSTVMYSLLIANLRKRKCVKICRNWISKNQSSYPKIRYELVEHTQGEHCCSLRLKKKAQWYENVSQSIQSLRISYSFWVFFISYHDAILIGDLFMICDSYDCLLNRWDSAISQWLWYSNETFSAVGDSTNTQQQGTTKTIRDK